jgi:hypothetical protein
MIYSLEKEQPMPNHGFLNASPGYVLNFTFRGLIIRKETLQAEIP